jgi:hypothetical protein
MAGVNMALRPIAVVLDLVLPEFTDRHAIR